MLPDAHKPYVYQCFEGMDGEVVIFHLFSNFFTESILGVGGKEKQAWSTGASREAPVDRRARRLCV